MATQARSVYSVFLAASPFVILILILIVSICIVLAHFLTKQLLHPIERLAENMEDTIEEPVYKELVPFVNTIRKQHENILMAAKVRQDFTANVSHELKDTAYCNFRICGADRKPYGRSGAGDPLCTGNPAECDTAAFSYQ